MNIRRMAFLLAATLALPAEGQNADKPAAAGHEIAAPVQFHHDMQRTMRELSQAVEGMADEMGRASTPEAQKAMAARMQEVSGMVQKMSGLLARPAHGAEDRAQLEQMRKRLQALSGTAGVAARPRAAADVDARMAELETQFDQLDAEMDRIRSTSDPAERGRLLARHERKLRQATRALREVDRSFSREMRAMMGGGAHGMSAERMMLVHDLMNRRLALMGRVMEQVMEQSMGHGEAPAR